MAVKLQTRLKECTDEFAVAVIRDGVEVFRSREYRSSAEYAQKAYNLTDEDLIAMYKDYKRTRGW